MQILHDYFLTMADGTSFFELNKSEKQNLLEQKTSRSLYSGHQIFDIAPVDKTILSENKILFARTPLGFILGTEVDVTDQAGETRYKPVYDIPRKVALSFSLKSKLPYFKSLTNVRLNPPFPATYYFTNKGRQEFDENTGPPHTTLPLSQKALAPQNGEIYEMGSLLNFGSTFKQAIRQTNGSDLPNWKNIEDRRFVTHADHMLLPHKFQYRLSKNQLVTKVEAVLEDTGNNEIKKIIKTSTGPINSILLDFSKIDVADSNPVPIESGIYLVKIKTNSAQQIVHQLHLNDKLYNRDHFGVIDLRFDEENSPFSLLNDQGFLKAKIDNTGQKVPHPVFEIRLGNRTSYWRYHKDSPFTNDEIAATSGHLDNPTSHLLIAKQPKGLTATLVPFQNGSTLLLPHPKAPNIRIEQDKIYSDIYINQSNGLLKN